MFRIPSKEEIPFDFKIIREVCNAPSRVLKAQWHLAGEGQILTVVNRDWAKPEYPPMIENEHKEEKC